MKVLIDTNILISAALSNKGTPYKAFIKAVNFPFRGIICEQNVSELRRIFSSKFPNRLSALETFLSTALLTLDYVAIPDIAYDIEQQLRDVNDRPILRAAIYADADMILTGDKDFLESGIQRPRMISASDFINYDYISL